MVQGFTSLYNINQLVYYEEYHKPEDAILREKQINGWGRTKKIKLIEEVNLTWTDIVMDGTECFFSTRVSGQ